MAERTCSFPNCGKPMLAKNLCGGHYAQKSRGRSLTPLGPPRPPAPPLGSVCSFPDCGKPIYAKELCNGHYYQRQKGRHLTPFRAFRRKDVDPTEWFLAGFDTSGGDNACHEWQRARTGDGYGKEPVVMYEIYGKRGAHVIRWIIENGPFADDLNVLHHCDNPPCGNLCHLFLGTNADNVRDKVEKGRQARGRRKHVT